MATAKNSTSKTSGTKTTEKVKMYYDPQKAAAASKTSAKKNTGKTCPKCGQKIR